jgi:hypothetical protein
MKNACNGIGLLITISTCSFQSYMLSNLTNILGISKLHCISEHSNMTYIKNFSFQNICSTINGISRCQLENK